MGKRKKKVRPENVAALEHGLAKLSQLQVHHEAIVSRLKTKIAAQEELIADAKIAEAEAEEKAAKEREEAEKADA